MSSKITDLIKEDGVSYSFEVTPDVSYNDLENLDIEPLFFSITWHAHVHECKDLDIAPLKLARYLRNKGKNVLVHMSCTKMKKDYLDKLIIMLKDQGICNLFVILGEKFDPASSDFKNTHELILYIRQKTGSYFCIGAAGVPGTDDRIAQLKEKVACGVDFILTQAFFEGRSFETLITKCREAGITVPIIPGIFPFETEKELDGFVNMCKVYVTEDVRMMLNNQTGTKILGNLINEIVQVQKINHLHFFTLNKLQRTVDLIKNSGMSQSM